jgi:hypothetical protein
MSQIPSLPESAAAGGAGGRGRPAQDWFALFAAAQVLTEELEACKSARAKATRVGKWLNPRIGRPVPIEIDGRAATATLRAATGHAGRRRYFFAIQWATEPAGAGPSPAAPVVLAPPPGDPPPGTPQGDMAAPADSRPRRHSRRRRPERPSQPPVQPPTPGSAAGGNDEPW